MTPSPAHVLMQYLRDLGVVSAPGKPPPDDWASTVGSVPPEPGNVVTLMNTGAVYEGRSQRSPQPLHRPKVQLIVRANDELTGWDKGKAVEAALNAVGLPTQMGGVGRTVPVTTLGHHFAMRGVHVRVPLTNVGQDEDTRRQLYSINALVTMLEVTPENYTLVFPQADPQMDGDFLLGYQGGTQRLFTPDDAAQFVRQADATLTPPVITAHVADYAPGRARTLRLRSGDGSISISGLAAGRPGDDCRVLNVGAHDFILQHDTSQSAAANRFYCTTEADVTVHPAGWVDLWYDGTSARWRVNAGGLN